MSKAKQEIMHWHEYDYAVVNANLNDCLKKLKIYFKYTIIFLKDNLFLNIKFLLKKFCQGEKNISTKVFSS